LDGLGALPIIDPNWTLLDDHTPPVKVRNVRGPSGMIVGRVLLSPKKTVFDAEIFNRDQWLHVGEFREFEQAVAAAAMNIGSSLVSSSDAKGAQP
jgi:hypothetical protein